MSTRSRLAAFVLTLVLSGIILAPPAFAMREEPHRDDPIVRILKRLLRTVGIGTNEHIAVPKP